MRLHRRLYPYQRQLPDVGGRGSRRAFLLALAAVSLRGDDAQQVWDVLSDLASALSEGNAIAFLKPFDRKMPGFETLERDVTALLNANTVQSSIQIEAEQGDSATQTVELDWQLLIVEQQNSASSFQRKERVRVKFAKQGKNWRITSLEPLVFFAPPRPG